MTNDLMQMDLSVWGMYQHADIVVKAVMIGLLLASVVTWAIFFSKSFELSARETPSETRAAALAGARSLQEAHRSVQL